MGTQNWLCPSPRLHTRSAAAMLLLSVISGERRDAGSKELTEVIERAPRRAEQLECHLRRRGHKKTESAMGIETRPGTGRMYLERHL